MLDSRKKSLCPQHNNNGEANSQDTTGICPSIPMWITNNKINIVLDIDQTLLYGAQCNPSDIAAIKVGNPLLGETIRIFNYKPIAPMIVALFIRPYAEKMVEVLSSFCNLYIYTKAIQAYAEHVAVRLDPENKCFKKIIFNDLYHRAGLKTLSRLFDEKEQNKALILDDSPDVWVKHDMPHIIESVNYAPLPQHCIKPTQQLWNSLNDKDSPANDFFSFTSYINETFSVNSSQLNVITEFIKSVYLEYLYSPGTPIQVVYRNRVGKILSGQSFAIHISCKYYNLWNAVRKLIPIMGGVESEESSKIISVDEKGTIEYGYIIHCYYYKCALSIEDYIIK